MVYVGLTGLTQALLGKSALEITATLIDIPLSIVFLIWTGWVLSARRIEPRALVPFACLAAGLIAAYTIGASVYLPHLFSTLSTRYGVIGAVFAMISALFCLMVVLVGSAAGGREIHEERSHPARRATGRGRGAAPVGGGHGAGALALGHAAHPDREAPPPPRRR